MSLRENHRKAGDSPFFVVSHSNIRMLALIIMKKGRGNGDNENSADRSEGC